MMLPAPSTTMVMILIKCTLRTSFQCSSLLYRFKLLVSVIVYTFLEMSWSIPIDAPSQLSSAGLWFNLKHIFTPEITKNNWNLCMYVCALVRTWTESIENYDFILLSFLSECKRLRRYQLSVIWNLGFPIQLIYTQTCSHYNIRV